MSRRSWALPFAALAALGTVAGAVINLVSLAGIGTPQASTASSATCLGLIIVWIPAYVVAERRVRRFGWRGFWKAATRGAPRWMRWMAGGAAAYAFLLFLEFGLWRLRTGHAADAVSRVRLLSAYAMGFHAIAFSVLYSYLREGESSESAVLAEREQR